MRYLRFRASPETIDTIVRTRFHSADFDDCVRNKDDRPAWWRPVQTPSTACYAADPFDDAFAGNQAWLVYDPASQQAYFH